MLGLAVPIAAWVVFSVCWRRWWRKARARHRRGDEPVCANCGYDLGHLDLPRCPECGALRGFRVPLDQLGLTEAEVRTGFEQQRRRRADASENGPAGAAQGPQEPEDPGP